MEPVIVVAVIGTGGSILISILSGVFGIINNREIRKLKEKLEGAFNYIEYLLAGIDTLTKQIVEELKSKPNWSPDWKWPKEDK